MRELARGEGLRVLSSQPWEPHGERSPLPAVCALWYAHVCAHIHTNKWINKTKASHNGSELPGSYWAREMMKSRSQESRGKVHEEIPVTHQVSHYTVIFKINGKF